MKTKFLKIKWLLWILVLLPNLVFANPGRLSDVVVSSGPDSAHIEFLLTEQPPYHIFTLENPNRLVVDLTGTRLSTRLLKLTLNNSVIKSMRGGRYNPQTLRLVFELTQPVHFRSFSHEYKLILDIYSRNASAPKLAAQSLSAPASFEKKSNTSKHANASESANTSRVANTAEAAKTAASSNTSKAVSAPEATNSSRIVNTPAISKNANTSDSTTASTSENTSDSSAPKTKSSNTDQSSSSPTPLATDDHDGVRTVVIVIDPGHGGKDPGAIGENGTREKTVVLGISRKLAALINQTPHMRAELTRDGDYFVPLRQRLKLARKGKADLFVAVHADSYFNNNSSGASVYALSHRGATSEAARWLAKRDNNSELSGVDLGELEDKSYALRSVLIDLAQTATITDSLRLGNSILDSLDNITRLHYTRVEQAPFVVLKSPDIPSVLVETGFISNTREEERLRTEGYQHQLAQALFNGIKIYIKKYSVMNT